jgi:transcriptional regulator with XRE-family HTH domain
MVKRKKESFGDFLAKRRAAKKASVADVAKATGIPERTLRTWEKGTGEVISGRTIARLNALADYFDLPPYELRLAAGVE